MKQKKKDPGIANPEKTLSNLIEKLNAEIKVMNEINPSLSVEKENKPDHISPKSRINNPKSKTKRK
jgi:hypothetical protein